MRGRCRPRAKSNNSNAAMLLRREAMTPQANSSSAGLAPSRGPNSEQHRRFTSMAPFRGPEQKPATRRSGHGMTVHVDGPSGAQPSAASRRSSIAVISTAPGSDFFGDPAGEPAHTYTHRLPTSPPPLQLHRQTEAGSPFRVASGDPFRDHSSALTCKDMHPCPVRRCVRRPWNRGKIPAATT